MWCVHSKSVRVKGAAGFDSSMCRCCRLQIPMHSDSSWGLSCAPGILTMLPQHVNATPPTCGTRPMQRALPQSALHQEGILINLPLSLPFHPSPSVYDIDSTARKSDTFPAVVSVNQESASGQVNRTTLVMWVIFKFGMCSYILVTVVQPIRNYMLMHPLARHPPWFPPITWLFKCRRRKWIISFDSWCQIEVAHLPFSCYLIEILNFIY